MKGLEVNNGDTFYKLTVINELPRKVLPSGQTNRVFLCKCDCGKLKEVRLVHLSRGRIKSCGCISNIQETEELRYIRKIWRAVKYRTHPKYFERHLYYDKGVRMCKDWSNNFESFKIWALENGLKKGLHIDRIDGNSGYEPNNCRVVTPVENANNRENTFIVEYDGVKYPFMELVRKKRLEDKQYSIRARIKRGWKVEEAIDTPIKNGNYKTTKRRV